MPRTPSLAGVKQFTPNDGLPRRLALSQVLTLYTTPVIYICFDKLRTWMSRGKTPSADIAALLAE